MSSNIVSCLAFPQIFAHGDAAAVYNVNSVASKVCATSSSLSLIVVIDATRLSIFCDVLGFWNRRRSAVSCSVSRIVTVKRGSVFAWAYFSIVCNASLASS